MPMLPIIAVFYSDLEWVRFEFADHSLSSPLPFTALLKNIEEIDSSAWLALRYAVQSPNQWTAVV